jgi:transcriptional regulator with XRE-family HTH domain
MATSRGVEIRRIGRQVRAIREKSGRTLAQIAKAAGLSERAVRELEAGRTNPSLSTLVSIVNALGVKLDDLIAEARRSAPEPDYTPASATVRATTRLTRQLPDARMKARILKFSRAEAAVPEPPSEAVFGHVLDGRIAVALDGRETTLERGDSFHAQRGVLGAWRAEGLSGGRLLVVAAISSDREPGSQSNQQDLP